MRIGAILLAAGCSRRFGADKLSQSIPGDRQWIAERSATLLRQAVGEVVAVVRPGHKALTTRLSALGVACLDCEESACGMGHSLAHGVSASVAWDGWVIMLADMPLIRAESVAAVANALQRGAVIAAPSYRGRRGHPVGFGQSCFSQLTALRGDTGARTILAERAGEIVPIPCDDPAVLLDVDTPADLAALDLR